MFFYRDPHMISKFVGRSVFERRKTVSRQQTQSVSEAPMCMAHTAQSSLQFQPRLKCDQRKSAQRLHPGKRFVYLPALALISPRMVMVSFSKGNPQLWMNFALRTCLRRQHHLRTCLRRYHRLLILSSSHLRQNSYCNRSQSLKTLEALSRLTAPSSAIHLYSMRRFQEHVAGRTG
jgi:hypothetical protein